MVTYINDFDASITQRTSIVSGACITGLIFGASAGLFTNNNPSVMFAFNPILGIGSAVSSLLFLKQIKKFYTQRNEPQEDLRYSWIMFSVGTMTGIMGCGTIYAAMDYSHVSAGISLFVFGLVSAMSLVISYHWLKGRDTNPQHIVVEDIPARNFINLLLLKVLSTASGIAIPFLSFGAATNILPSENWLVNFAFTTAILPASILGVPALLTQSFCKCCWGTESLEFAKKSIESGWYSFGTALSLSTVANSIIYGATKEMDIRISISIGAVATFTSFISLVKFMYDRNNQANGIGLANEV